MNQRTSTHTADDQTDWGEINREAFEHALRPVALPERDGIPFWNQYARQFIMPPAFEALSLPEAAEYRFVLKNAQGRVLAEFAACSPQEPLTPVWADIPVGMVTLTIEALDRNRVVLKNVLQREFYRAAWFRGPYPAKSHDYREAAFRCFSYVYNLPHIQAWLENGTVDEKIYRKYCYPSKTLSAIIECMLNYVEMTQDGELRRKAHTIAAKMADWLIDNSCPAGTPLEFLPPTYWKYATYENARVNIGQIMMIYPANVGGCYLRLYRELGARKYLEAAIRIGETLKKLELPGGCWYLKLYEETGKPSCENIVLLEKRMNHFLIELSEVTRDSSYRAMRDRAYRRLINHNLKLWDWDGQFEDVVPQARYHNLTKDQALFLASELFRQGDRETALKLVDWSEDQFLVWSDPSPELRKASMFTVTPDNASIVLPTALEQYNCYWPVDGSMSAFISAWSKTYRYTGNRVYLEKAKALADAILRNQRPDGSIPTWFFSIDLPDWLNCMIGTSKTLLELDETIRG